VKAERNAEIVRLREQGLTLRAIGESLGITTERVRQILRRQAEIAAAPSATPPSGPSILTDQAVRSLFIAIDDLEVSVRAYNRFKEMAWVMVDGAGVQTHGRFTVLGDLAVCTRKQLRTVKGVGRLIVAEVEELLRQYELEMGARIPGWRSAKWPTVALSRSSAALLDPRVLRPMLGLPD
jgi:DNA-directed RNA polymerase alpha subunit